MISWPLEITLSRSAPWENYFQQVSGQAGVEILETLAVYRRVVKPILFAESVYYAAPTADVFPTACLTDAGQVGLCLADFFENRAIKQLFQGSFGYVALIHDGRIGRAQLIHRPQGSVAGHRDERYLCWVRPCAVHLSQRLHKKYQAVRQ